MSGGQLRLLDGGIDATGRGPGCLAVGKVRSWT